MLWGRIITTLNISTIYYIIIVTLLARTKPDAVTTLPDGEYLK